MSGLSGKKTITQTKENYHGNKEYQIGSGFERSSQVDTVFDADDDFVGNGAGEKRICAGYGFFQGV
jgi:hypothetical protein